MQDDIYNDALITIWRPYWDTYSTEAWYDLPMKRLWFCANDNTYKVGHAAAILVEKATWNLWYCDFWRYHAPNRLGRVRDQETDPDVSIPLKARFSKDWSISNIDEILKFANNHTPLHGAWAMFSSVFYWSSYKRWLKYVKDLQNRWLVPYGPFVLWWTNCSRFVNKLCRVSYPCWYTKLRWLLTPTLTPTTKHNVTVHNAYYFVEWTTITKNNRISFLGKKMRYGFMRHENTAQTS